MDARRQQRSGAVDLLVAIGSLGNGGSERQVTELLVRLPPDRFRPKVLTFDGDGSPGPLQHRERLAAAGIPILGIEPSPGRAAVRRARMVARTNRVLDDLKPALVYAWLDEAAAVLAPLCRMKRIPCLVARRNIIGSMGERGSRYLSHVINLAESQAALVTANSAAVARDCVRRGHDPGHVRLVRNGHASVDPLPMPARPPTVLGCVAQFRPEKGHHRLIDALRRVPEGDWRVDLGGGGVLLDEVRRRVEAEGLADRVGFLGPVADVRSFWAQRHIALLLSDSEGFPNALLEAAFAGRPAIATDVGGTAEVVGPGGLLASPDDPEAIAAAIWQLIGDETRSAALGRAAWEHVSRTYTLDGMVGDHLLALEELVTAQGGRASARRERRGSLRTRLRGAKTTTSTDSCAR